MHFARISIRERVPAKGWRRLFGRTRAQKTLVATREFFPNRFYAAFRQKSRWTVGIALQGWRNFGWKAGLRVRYLFWRDRRGLFLAHVTVLGVVAFLAFLMLELYPLVDPSAGRPAPLLPEDSWLWTVVWVNLGLLAHRLIQRHLWAYVHYGMRTLPMVTPRYLWAVAVNYCALVRALRLWERHLRTGKPIGWDKTAHVFPIGASPEAPAHRSFGDVLLDLQLIEAADLAHAQACAAAEGRRLEEVLLEDGHLSETDLAGAVARHVGASLCTADPSAISVQQLSKIPKGMAERLRCVPIAETPAGRLMVAVALPLKPSELARLEEQLQGPVEISIATQSFIARSLARLEAHLRWKEHEAHTEAPAA
jgi:bacteriophage N4 adsorption protein B